MDHFDFQTSRRTCLLNSLYQRYAGDFILGDANHVRGGVWRSGYYCVYGFSTLKRRLKLVQRSTRHRRRSTYQDSIIGTWFPASLCVTKCCDTSVKPESVMKDILDVIRIDVVKLGIYGSLRNDNNGLPLADLSMLSS
jgi:hypothetical protein